MRAVLQDFASKRPSVLVGTQMVAKGHDFADVTLVIVADADTGLYIPDFRAAERTFQLLTQVAGRAGRAERPGRVLVQTWNPQVPCIRMALERDEEAFYGLELESRQRLGYPPFAELVRLMTVAEESGLAELGARHLLDRLGPLFRGEGVARPGAAADPAGPEPLASSGRRAGRAEGARDRGPGADAASGSLPASRCQASGGCRSDVLWLRSGKDGSRTQMSAKRGDFSMAPFQKRRLGQLRVLGDPVLKQPTVPVTVFDSKLEKLAGLMLEVMEREEGVGLAANQIGVLSRVLVWRHPEIETERYVFVNPQIVERSETCCTESEGCLSVPGASMEVTRAEEVVVEAQDLAGEPLSVHVTGLLARIIQHEVDHLDGYLILDRTSPEERRRVLKRAARAVPSGGNVNFAFAGTPEFSAWLLYNLAKLGHRPSLVISQPDRPKGRGLRVTSTPTAAEAQRLGLECVQTEDINDPALIARMLEGGVSALLVASFGQMLQRPLLEALLCLNVHTSLLPKYRGAAPIERALAAGETQTGVTVMRVTEKLDTGPWALQTSLSLSLFDDAASVARALGVLGAIGAGHVMTALPEGSVVWTEQTGPCFVRYETHEKGRRPRPYLGSEGPP